MIETIRFRVAGRVQGVYFRVSTRTRAQALGLTGWVKNLADGQVEGVACGERGALDELTAWLREGPEAAEVTHLEVETASSWSGVGFVIL